MSFWEEFERTMVVVNRNVRDYRDGGDGLEMDYQEEQTRQAGPRTWLAEATRRLAAEGYLAPFRALFRLDGTRVATRLIDGKFGKCWALLDADDLFVGTFINYIGPCRLDDNPENFEGFDPAYLAKLRKSHARKVANQAKKGYVEKMEMAPARARLQTAANGIEQVVIVRTDGR